MTVHLVGAGPGDPGLLTVRARELLERAEVVVHDRLVSAAILDTATTAERVDVGKRCARSWDQASINALLVDLGRSRSRVVRLKGGDPFLFGRGMEEAAALAVAGVPHEVVPGVSSAFAAPAAAGIAVTRRGISASVTVVTGHREPGAPPVDWHALARTGGTLVVLMGVERRGAIAADLQTGGLPPSTPVAVVESATRAEQRCTRTRLADLAKLDVAAPATIVIGAVASQGLDALDVLRAG